LPDDAVVPVRQIDVAAAVFGDPRWIREFRERSIGRCAVSRVSLESVAGEVGDFSSGAVPYIVGAACKAANVDLGGRWVGEDAIGAVERLQCRAIR
jgi:hypothetical protein